MSTPHLRGLDHAIDLANRGWKVIPYLDKPNGGQVPNWQNSATDDMEQIYEWFDVGGTYENAYVAVIPALVGKTCIDIDVHEGKASGFETLKQLKIPSSAMVTGTSRSGNGKHLWFDGVGTSRQIYSGVDRKSISGLVRVPYLLPPVEDVFESLPAPFQIFNSQPTGVEYSGSHEEWLTKYSEKPLSPKVASLAATAPVPFKGHTDLLRIQTGLVKLAVEGHGGVPEALLELKANWMAAEHGKGVAPEVEWAQALVGAICAFGGAVPKLDFENMHPDCFFEKSRLLSEITAKAVCSDLAIGIDSYLWSYSEGVWAPDPLVLERRLFKLLRDRYEKRFVGTITSAVTAGLGIPRLAEKPDDRYINMRNCMLDWRTGETLQHAPEFLSTLQMTFDYDKNAKSPNFDAWLNEVLPVELHKLFWELFGYMFLVGNPLQKAVLLFGRAGTGKSTFLRLLEFMLGRKNVSNVTLRGLSQGVFDSAQLFGKIANIAGDIDSKYLEDSSTFKQITGEDTIQAQHKHQQLFSFQAFAVPIFSANKMWRSADTTDGYFRRWVVIPFQHQVDRSKAFDEAAIHAEASGIFNQAVAALRTLMERKEFSMQGEALQLFEEFQAESDVVRQWLRDDDMVSTETADTRTLRKDVYDRYRTWCSDNGFKPSSSAELYKSLAALGFETVKSNGYHYACGIGIVLVPSTVGELL